MNKHLIISAVIFLLPLSIFAQSNDSSKCSKFSIGITGSPDYSYRFLHSDGSNLANTITSGRNNTEIGLLRYNVGLNCAYSISNRASLQSGLLFADMGYTTKSQ